MWMLLCLALGRFGMTMCMQPIMFQNRCLQMLMRSISINATYTPKLKQVFTIDILTKLIRLCDTLAHGILYKAIFLVAFFSYLHLSSLVRSSRFHIFPLLHSHFVSHRLGRSLTLPRTKMHQHYDQSHSVVLPCIKHSALCPVAAITEMFSRIPEVLSGLVVSKFGI